MRVAFTGTHRTGKTSLIDAVSGRLPTYRVVEEPYRLLEEEGYEFSDPPSPEDFERQLRSSIDAIAAAPAEVLVDRCPLDFVAYLDAIGADFDLESWLPEIRDCLESLDLLVVVSIEVPDRIVVLSHEDRRLRRDVDDRLRTLALEDAHEFGTLTVEVSGTLEDRVREVMRAMKIE
jgi:hypothetical protein